MTELRNNSTPNTFRLSTGELQKIPTLPEAPSDASELIDKKNKRNKVVRAAIAAAATVGIATAGFFTYKSFEAGNSDTIEADPVLSSEPLATTNPIETDPPAEVVVPPVGAETLPGEPLTPEVIPAGLSTDELGQKIVGNLNSWLNAYIDVPSDELEDDRPAGVTYLQQYEQLSLDKSDEFSEVMFTPNWQSDESLVKLHDTYAEYSAYFLAMHNATDPIFNDADIEEFRQTTSFVSAEQLPSETGETRLLEITLKETNNADKNRVGEELGGDALDHTLVIVVEISEADGTARMMNHKVIAQQL